MAQQISVSLSPKSSKVKFNSKKKMFRDQARAGPFLCPCSASFACEWGAEPQPGRTRGPGEVGLVTVRYSISFLPAAGQWPARRGVRASGGGSGGSGRQMETATGTDLKHPRPQARLPARLLRVPVPGELAGAGRAAVGTPLCLLDRSACPARPCPQAGSSSLSPPLPSASTCCFGGRGF